MSEKLLPLGTVVYLENGVLPLMIVARQPILNLNDELCYLDYAAISHLTGLDKDKIAYFNHEDIKEVVFEGYVGEYEDKILAALSEWRKQNRDISKGKVEEQY